MMEKEKMEKEKILMEILSCLVEHDYVPTSRTHARIFFDLCRIDFDTFQQLAQNKSPSQLGRLGLLGARFMAKCRRDHPQKYQQIMSCLRQIYQRHAKFFQTMRDLIQRGIVDTYRIRIGRW